MLISSITHTICNSFANNMARSRCVLCGHPDGKSAKLKNITFRRWVYQHKRYDIHAMSRQDARPLRYDFDRQKLLWFFSTYVIFCSVGYLKTHILDHNGKNSVPKRINYHELRSRSIVLVCAHCILPTIAFILAMGWCTQNPLPFQLYMLNL